MMQISSINRTSLSALTVNVRKYSKSVVLSLLMLISFTSRAQKYPVSLTANLTPPYSLCLDDYMKSDGPLSLMAIVNDMSVDNMQVYVHVKMQSAGVTIETIDAPVVAPITINAGPNAPMFGDDFAQSFLMRNLKFSGYSQDKYKSTNQLPGGLWKISVDIRHLQTHRRISNVATATAWMVTGEPPVLRGPSEKEIVGTNGTPITFNWFKSKLQGGSGTVQYTLELWEKRNSMLPNEVFVASMPEFADPRTTTGTSITIYPQELNLEPGITYVWRVTASDPSGNIKFARDGRSECRSFQYLCKCGMPSDVKTEVSNASTKFKWNTGDNNISYNIDLEQIEGGDTSIVAQSYVNSFSLLDLPSGSKWRVRVSGECPDNLNSDSTPWTTFDVPGSDMEDCPTCGCGSEAVVRKITDFNPIELKEGNKIENKTGKTKFEIKTATANGDGTYKGQFYMKMTLWGTKFLCEYENLKVNKDSIIVGGTWRSVENDKFLLDPSKVVEQVVNRYNEYTGDFAAATYNNHINDTITINRNIYAIHIDEDGHYIAVDANNNEEDITSLVGNNKHTLVKDAQGNEFVIVANDKQPMGVSEFRQAGSNTTMLEQINKEKDKKVTGAVTFSAAANQVYGFDAFDGVHGESMYEKIGTDNYTVSYKSIESFKKDKVEANGADAEVTFKDNYGMPVVSEANTLSLFGKGNGEESYIYAYGKPNEGEEQGDVLGRLNVVSYQMKTVNVILVQVNNSNLHDQMALEDELNKIFKPAIAKVKVTEGDPISGFSYTSGSMFVHGGSGIFTVFSNDEKNLIKKYEERTGAKAKGDDYVLFYVQNATKLDENGNPDNSIHGYMPQGYHYGFIFGGASMATVAHELCHGAFTLKHTFEPGEQYLGAKGSSNNLMDYTNSPATATELNHTQWDLIHNPDPALFKFLQDEEEGEAFGVDTHTMCVDDEVVNYLKENYRYYYLPDGRILDAGTNHKFVPSGFYTEKDGTINARGGVALIQAHGCDYLTIYSGNRTVAFGYKGNDSTAVKKVIVGADDALSATSELIKSYNPVRVRIYNNSIKVIDSKYQVVKTFEISQTRTCQAKQKLFFKTDEEANMYINYAKSNPQIKNTNLSDEKGLIERFANIASEEYNLLSKEGVSDIANNEKYLGERIVDKFIAYENLNGKKFRVATCLLDKYISTNQSDWDEFAKEVFTKANLGPDDILITIPYIQCRVGPDIGIMYFMPGIATGANVKVDLSKIKTYSQSPKTVSPGASSPGYDINNSLMGRFIMDVFSNTHKKLIVHEGIFTCQGNVVYTKYRNDNISGYDRNEMISLKIEKGVQEYANLIYKTRMAEKQARVRAQSIQGGGVVYNQEAYYDYRTYESQANSLVAQIGSRRDEMKSIMDVYHNESNPEKLKEYTTIIQSSLEDYEASDPIYKPEMRESYMSAMNSSYDRMSNAQAFIMTDAFNELRIKLEVPTTDRFTPNGCLFDVSSNFDYFMKKYDKYVYFTIDFIGIALSGVGLDIAADAAGIVYSVCRGNWTEAALYGASTMVEGFSHYEMKYFKELSKETAEKTQKEIVQAVEERYSVSIKNKKLKKVLNSDKIDADVALDIIWAWVESNIVYPFEFDWEGVINSTLSSFVSKPDDLKYTNYLRNLINDDSVNLLITLLNQESSNIDNIEATINFSKSLLLNAIKKSDNKQLVKVVESKTFGLCVANLQNISMAYWRRSAMCAEIVSRLEPKQLKRDPSKCENEIEEIVGKMEYMNQIEFENIKKGVIDAYKNKTDIVNKLEKVTFDASQQVNTKVLFSDKNKVLIMTSIDEIINILK